MHPFLQGNVAIPFYSQFVTKLEKAVADGAGYRDKATEEAQNSLRIYNSVVPRLSVVPLKIGKNNCKPGETHRKTRSICKIPTLYRVNLAEDRHQHSSGGLSIFGFFKKIAK